jgi:hypothetical protein
VIDSGRVAHPMSGFEFSGAGPFGLQGSGFKVHFNPTLALGAQTSI